MDKQIARYMEKQTDALTAMNHNTTSLASSLDKLSNNEIRQTKILAKSFTQIDVKQEMIFKALKYVIGSLIAGLLALIGLKLTLTGGLI